VGATAARAVSEEFPVQATAVSCCGITDMNNTIIIFIIKIRALKNNSFIYYL
jgi:hypothetical protein